MVAIENVVNIKKILSSLPLHPGKDYIYFLDSTLARFWTINPKAYNILEQLFSNLPGGEILTKSDRYSYKLDPNDRGLGDIVWWANRGTMIFPNFWQVRNPKKGMHGYRNDVRDNHATFVFHNSTKDIKKHPNFFTMRDVYEIVLTSLGFDDN